MIDLAKRKAFADQMRRGSPFERRRVSTAGIEVRDLGDGGLSMSGYASVTELAYDMGYYQETIKRGAFGKTLSESPDVQLLLNHEGLPMARTLSGNLRLSEDERGLKVDADLDPNDLDVQRLLPKVQRGDIDQMSFAFRVTRQTWDEEYTRREIAEVNLNRGDVSIVNQGANPATSFSLRDATDFLAGLSRDEFVSLMRTIAPDLAPSAPAPAATPESRGMDLDLARARAFALRSRG